MAEGGARREALLALHAERETLERRLALAHQQRLYLKDEAATRAAEDDEQALLRDLDRVMTRIRAAEVQSRPGSRKW
ncbi:hypothetical protein [uncultured Methylobacterium sp.]|uniref:hypothetical protein n=1 Tax=uncultured Methylobacterium sp. TaxID=157278 RepID=UPI00260E8B13|nr:hypothetical protein [uncultured Methylobacterium sp.]